MTSMYVRRRQILSSFLKVGNCASGTKRGGGGTMLAESRYEIVCVFERKNCSRRIDEGRSRAERFEDLESRMSKSKFLVKKQRA